jgi:hypothetical protein
MLIKKVSSNQFPLAKFLTALRTTCPPESKYANPKSK